MTGPRPTTRTKPDAGVAAAAERAARRHRARARIEPDDMGQTFVCLGRLYGEGRLYLLLMRPGVRLLIEQPEHLPAVRKGEHLTVDHAMALVRADSVNDAEGEGRHAR
jgi:hypothetical protein